jgi:outer membrane lipoprotein SlyB
MPIQKYVFVSLMCVVFAALSSCASRPKLYPNKKYETVGEKTAEHDIEACMERAKKYVGSERGKNAGKGAGAGAAIGAAMGAAAGLFTGNIGRGALQGGAIGGAGGAAAGAISPEQMKKNFTERCLHEKGYEVLGWD